jgi:hypothetical protein
VKRVAKKPGPVQAAPATAVTSPPVVVPQVAPQSNSTVA